MVVEVPIHNEVVIVNSQYPGNAVSRRHSGLTLPHGFDSQTYAIGGQLPLEIRTLHRQVVRFFEDDDDAASLADRFFDGS